MTTYAGGLAAQDVVFLRAEGAHEIMLCAIALAESIDDTTALWIGEEYLNGFHAGVQAYAAALRVLAEQIGEAVV